MPYQRAERLLEGERLAAGGGVEVRYTPTVPWHKALCAGPTSLSLAASGLRDWIGRVVFKRRMLVSSPS